MTAGSEVVGKLELLPDDLAFQALRTSEDIETRTIVPPHVRAFWSLEADVIVVNLPNKEHWAAAAFWDVIALNPQWDSVRLSFFISGLVYDFNRFSIVLPLAVHEFKITEPVNAFGQRVKFDKDNSFAAGKYLESIILCGDERAAKFIG